MAGSGSRRAATMSDVAKRAGVSITTVSHVVNRTRRVAPATAELVFEAASEVGYVPNDLQRTLATHGLKTVGLAMSAISHLYFGAVVHSIEETLSMAGYSLLLSDTHDESAGEVQAVAELLRKHVDAVILAPVGDSTRILSYTAKQGVPVVVIDRPVPADVDQVAAESVQPTAELVDHLAGLGHRRIAMISGRTGLTTTTERIQGYRLGLQRSKRAFHRALQLDGDSTAAGARIALRQLMALDRPPTALVVANHTMTIGVLRTAKEIGVRIPDDLAVVCFDDFEWADLFHPGLTAIAQPTETMGVQAANLVLSRLTDPELPSRNVRLKSTFVHRESCGCTASSRAATTLAHAY
ncbi:MAG: LacI family transcriptional regulator [Propionibacteriaceae bacterium]|nr:LacI family transcriptional regulator [Propionibacteriaceae bacterium]